MFQEAKAMLSENVPEYTRAEIEAFVQASIRYDRQALIGVAAVFIITALIFAALLWLIFALVPDDLSRIYATIGLSTTMIISAVSYWGYVLLPRVRWIISQSQGIGQRVYDTQRRVEEIET